jgi:hypothetical protein
MKASFLTAIILGVSIAATAEAQVSKLDCVIYKSSIQGGGELSNGTKVSMDMSGVAKEGDGPWAGLGEVGSIPMNFQIYLSDKPTGEFTLQINEGADSKAGSVLTSAILNQSGASKLLYRAVGSKDYVLVACYPTK